jgi:BioD-like phosphotransacetylase family protein
MGVVYLAGSRPGVGVTSIAVGLAEVWRKAGKHVSLVKPVALGDGADAEYFGTLGGTVESIRIGSMVESSELDEAARIVEALSRTSEIVVVEGLPLADGRSAEASRSLAGRLDCKVLGVVPYERSLDGSVASTWHDAFGSQIVGCVLNRRTVYGEHDVTVRVMPEFASAGLPVFVALPEDRFLLSPTVQQVTDHLQGTYFAGVDAYPELIEHFLIGGLIAEWGGNYFGRRTNQAVLVRGGRIDIQMSALNFPLNALILTGCQTPAQYVYQRAVELDVALLTVEADTQAVLALLESVESVVNARHAAKRDRMAQMLTESQGLQVLDSALGLI